MKIIKNENRLDRYIRIVVGLLLLTVGIILFLVLDNPTTSLVLLIVLGVLALISWLTAITGFCAIYALFGISTKNEQKQID